MDTILFLKEGIEFELSSKKEKGKVKFYFQNFPSELFSIEEAENILRTVFIQEDKGEFYKFVGNKQSKLLHVYSSNHLPDWEFRENFVDLVEATKLGYQQCPICFKKLPVIMDYETELSLGMEVAAVVRYYYPVVIVDEPQKRLREIGEKVINCWPLPLKGYSYKFTLIESDGINAIACPAGEIFVTSGLLNSVESDEELEMVLAHEITHVEQRHGYNQYKNAQAMAAAAQVIAIFAGSAGKQTNSSDIVYIISSVARNIVLAGYSRDNEREADAVAILYSEKNTSDGKRKFLLLLKKLKYLQDFYGETKFKLFASHPDLEKRINALQKSQFAFLNPLEKFDGLDKEGNVVASLELLYEMLYETKLTLVANLATTSNLNKKVKLDTRDRNWLSLKTEKTKYDLDLRDEAEIDIDDSTTIIFEMSGNQLISPTINKLSFDFSNVKNWVKSTKEE